MSRFLVALLFFSTLSWGQVHLVTNLNDSGSGSLRAQVGAAQPNDTVQFDPMLIANGSATLQLATPISITKAIVIIGATTNNDTLFISSSSSQRAFDIDVNLILSEVHIMDLAFVNFNTNTWGGGGVIRCEDAYVLSIERCVFRNNVVSHIYKSGGAIEAQNFKLRLKDCIFTNNGASSCSSSSNGTGGAINATNTTVEVDNCLFAGNSTCQAGGAINVAIGECMIRSSIFRNNTVLEGLNGAGGGAIQLNGANNSNISDCLFSNNSSKRAGGAVAITQSYGRVTIDRSEFYGNDAPNGNGGAINTFGVDSLFITHCSFNNNQYDVSSSFMSGGALYLRETFARVSASTLYNNDVPVIQLNAFNSWNLEIRNSTLANNTSSTKNLIDGDPQYTVQVGSSIFVGGGSGASIENNMTITSLGYNIFKDAPAFGVSSDNNNTSFNGLGLGAFGYNGGAGQSLLPSTSSIALNAGNPNDFSAAQTGPVFGQRDIGAAERSVIRNDSANACQYFLWAGQKLTQAGNYVDTVFNANSIDSIQTLSLSLTTIDTTLQLLNGALTSGERDSGVSYQWVDCNNGYTAIPGATDSSFTPNSQANFAVVITKGNCVDTSACLNNPSFSIPEITENLKWLEFYPNPSRGSISFSSGLVRLKSLSLSSLSGQELWTQDVQGLQKVQLPELKAGLYLLKWQGHQGEVQTDQLILLQE